MKKKISKNKPPKDLAILQRKILDDVLAREKLREKNKENPSDEAEREIERLTAEIEENQRISGAAVFPYIIKAVDEGAGKLVNSLREISCGVFLNPDNHEFIDGVLQTLIRLRNEFYDYQRHFLPNEDALKVVALYEEHIDSLKKLIEEKRKEAAPHFPEWAKYLKEPEFEMPDYYNEALANIMQMAEKRDEIAANLKNVLPHKRKEVIAGLAQMDKMIDEAEKVLAERYDFHQRKQRWYDGLRQMFKEASQSELHSMREHVKEHPGENPAIEKLLAEEFPE